LFGAGVLLLILLFSGQVRARLRFFLNKHFFAYKYNYRDEWLRFIELLSDVDQGQLFQENVIRAVGGILESNGGILWVKDGKDFFVPVARLSMPEPESAREPAGGSLPRFLEEREWVVDLSEYEHEPEVYAGLKLPVWLQNLPRAWLVVPLMHRNGLSGFVVLAQSQVNFTFNWEDTDLLKIVGRQAGSYLALYRTTEALAEARQFETFNRLSAYVVHDLKNLVAQLSLVTSNAKRHMHNPDFMEDAIHTVDNAVSKMTRLLAQLRKDRRDTGDVRRVEVASVLQQVVKGRTGEKPVPGFEAGADELYILADRERLAMVVEHLVQNAQEASSDDGQVIVRLRRNGQNAVVEIADHGCGMDAAFIRNRLFKPFDTTKGNAGMGIGVYESREFVRTHGGEIYVESVPGEGTTFRLNLPVAQAFNETVPIP
ncbi:MAG: PEP-CTERM system histidine kinase PrsK, partial [Gammaproteobacteria bacterium]|nr:PEP-CTERM system histidine kinase PrsK [Gammaproteobacteria bacterium]